MCHRLQVGAARTSDARKIDSMREIIGLDFQNILETKDVSMTLTGQRIDGHSVPCVLIANSSGGGIATTLDSNYYKGQGVRQGIEREYIIVISESNRPVDGK